MIYEPDGWIIVKVDNKEHKPFYKVFASWSGSYLHGDGWRLNSGITSVDDEEDAYLFHGQSVSKYRCRKDEEYRLTAYNLSVLESLIKKFPENLSVVPYSEVVIE